MKYYQRYDKNLEISYNTLHEELKKIKKENEILRYIISIFSKLNKIDIPSPFEDDDLPFWRKKTDKILRFSLPGASSMRFLQNRGQHLPPFNLYHTVCIPPLISDFLKEKLHLKVDKLTDIFDLIKVLASILFLFHSQLTIIWHLLLQYLK